MMKKRQSKCDGLVGHAKTHTLVDRRRKSDNQKQNKENESLVEKG
jgi:hypothetical protein